MLDYYLLAMDLAKRVQRFDPLNRYLRKSNYVLKITLDEWDIAINGRNSHNFKTIPERYVKGENDPAWVDEFINIRYAWPKDRV